MNLKGKRLLILGAGRGQIGLYRAAKEMGITTIAGTMPDNNPPCIPLADEVCYMNIIDPDEVESKTRDLQFDGLATCCLDRGLKALGRLCDRRSLPGYSESTATLCADKLAMKRRLMEHGVNTAEYAEVSNVEELAEAVDAIGGYPVIIKAVDLAGSMGINKAFNEKEAIRGFKNSMDATRRSHVIVERLLQGREFGAQAFITDGKVLFVMPHGDILYHSSTDVPVGHYVPFDCPAEMADKITAETEKAIKALGLDNCAVNIDFIEEDGKVYVLELSGRIGANGLPEVVSAHFGIDYYRMVVLASLGMSVRELWDSRDGNEAAMSSMVVSPDKEGTLRDIEYKGDSNLPGVFEINLFAKPGSHVSRFSNSSHCLGQIVTVGGNVRECRRTINEVTKNLNIIIE